MKDKTPLSTAQFMDAFFHRCAIGLLLVSAGFGLDVVEYAVGPDMARWVNYLSTGAGVLVLIVLFPWFVRFVLRVRKIGIRHDVDGYVVDMFRRSCARSFELTFIFMLVIEVLAGGMLEGVPGKILLDAVLSVSLAIASLTFLYLVSSSDDGDDIGEDDIGGDDL
jgi:hypothetical protein